MKQFPQEFGNERPYHFNQQLFDTELYDRLYYSYWRHLPDLYLEDVERRCRDSYFAGSLMLGPRDKPLKQVLVDDEKALREMNVTRTQIADVLDTVMELHKLEEYKQLNVWKKDVDKNGLFIMHERFHVSTERFFGSQRSPFQHPQDSRHFLASDNFLLTRSSDNRKFSFGRLLASMIRYNGFFEGQDIGKSCYSKILTSFRVDPREVVDFFQIQPQVDYSLTYVEQREWGSGASTHIDPNVDFEAFVKILALDQHQRPNGDTYYITWATLAFGVCSGRPPVDLDKVNIGELSQLETVGEQLDYVVERGAGSLKKPKSEILAAVERYRAGKSRVEDFHIHSDIGFLQLEQYGWHVSEAFEIDLFGAHLKDSGYDGSSGPLPKFWKSLHMTKEKHLVGWNKSIGSFAK